MKQYESPKILKETTIELYDNILAGSVVTKKSEVESVGQEVVEHSFVDDSHWE